MTGTITNPENKTPRRWLDGGPLTSLRDEMDNVFENFFGTPIVSRLTESTVPSIDVSETDDTVEIKTDIPGFKAGDVDIEVRDDYLTISGSSSEEKETEEGNGRKYHRIERRSGSFSRSVRMPCAVDQDNVDAELKDGVLSVVLAKAAEAKSKKVTVKSA